MRTATIAVTALLAVVAFAPAQSAGASKRVALQQCPEPLPSLVVWVKASQASDCDVGKAISRKFRRFVQDNKYNPNAPGFYNGAYHRQYFGWACHAGFVGSDEVVMGCRKRVGQTSQFRFIQGFFFAD
jgi:hypothetical protein